MPKPTRTRAEESRPIQPGEWVVGIGASAGGLKALQQFLGGVPEDSGMAYVVILHLDPERQSRMRELLQDRAPIPVTQVQGPTVVSPNHIYLIPPDQDLVMRHDRLELRTRGARAEHAPVDLFFRTLAESRGADVAGVVLSGTGSDGTAGIRYIREAGGITIAQSPEEAEYEGMPASAIATGLVDLVLPSGRICTELQRLCHPAATASAPIDGAADEAGLLKVLETLSARSGHDFSMYKRATLLRRLQRRVRFHRLTTLAEYHALVESSAEEHRALLRDLLISVSSFFRDPAAFNALSKQLPSLFTGKGKADAVRAWVVGCATGEEVYSLAMVMAEYASTLADPPRLQLFATDIDERGYTCARAGVYPPAALTSVSAERLQRFFTRENGGYRIAKSLREVVLFAGHNVLQDPPFSRMDLVSCRNLFIYLQPQAQERVLETFHFALNAGGLLFLGASESVAESRLFAPADGVQRLFRRNEAPRRAVAWQTSSDPSPLTTTPSALVSRPAGPAPPFSYSALHARMLEESLAATVVVNAELDVVHLSSAANEFLRLSEGTPTSKVLRLVRAEVARALRTALHQAFTSGKSGTRHVLTTIDGRSQQLTLHVRPFSHNGTSPQLALVIFEAAQVVGAAEEPGEPDRSEVELEAELRRTRDLLESTTAAHDQTVAELQTVNEELQSINEEQRAATEELETGREEIQAINEELTSINQEHQSTIEELKRTNADLHNLIESTEIGTIFVDRAMCIRRFTPAVTHVFNILLTDQGRPLAHVTHRLHYDALVADVAQVLESRARIEREVTTESGETYIARINPYRSFDGSHDGAVLTFFDNTERHRAGEELRAAKLLAESANLSKDTFLSTLSHEFRTPLNAILGYADLLSLDGPLTTGQQHKIGRMKAGGWHLAAMIEQILSFTRLDSGHAEVIAMELDARAVASEAHALMEPSALAKGLRMSLDLPDVPVRVVTDLDKARQVLVNLCSNAVKYTADGEIRLRVSTTPDRAQFEVIDTGIGIAADHLERIFERFWQVDGGRSRSAGGLGIGLAAAREYARLLNGDVTVESELGKGSTFRFWLPLVSAS